MILVDFSQVLIAAVMATTKNGKLPIEEGLIRHVALNMLRSYHSKFHKDYGEMIVCCDHKHSWRKDRFPLYKKHRVKIKNDSKLDWNEMYRYMDMMIKEIDENLPYRVICVDGAEGDDVIAVLCGVRPAGFLGEEPVMIVSGDEDFCQLQEVGQVTQYFPLKKRIIVNPNPKDFLLEHIICGDEGDGIPSILNSDNAIYDRLSKKKMMPKQLERLKKLALTNSLRDDENVRYTRNWILIDLDNIPKDLRISILAEFDRQKGKSRGKLFQYMMDKKLKGLMSSIGDF